MLHEALPRKIAGCLTERTRGLYSALPMRMPRMRWQSQKRIEIGQFASFGWGKEVANVGHLEALWMTWLSRYQFQRTYWLSSHGNRQTAAFSSRWPPKVKRISNPAKGIPRTNVSWAVRLMSNPSVGRFLADSSASFRHQFAWACLKVRD